MWTADWLSVLPTPKALSDTEFPLITLRLRMKKLPCQLALFLFIYRYIATTKMWSFLSVYILAFYRCVQQNRQSWTTPTFSAVFEAAIFFAIICMAVRSRFSSVLSYFSDFCGAAVDHLGMCQHPQRAPM